MTENGAQTSGTIQAASEQDAMRILKETHPAVIRLSRVQGIASRRLAGKIKEKSLAVLCAQFAIILSSGLPIVRAIELVANQTRNKALQSILRQTAVDVATGVTLAQALRTNGPALPVAFIETVRSGEESGTLDAAFRRLESHYDKSSKIRSKVASAMIYPAFTLVIAVIAIVIIMVKAVPAFTGIFASMDIALPWITRGLISMSDFLTRYWAVMLLVILAAILAYRLFTKSPRGRLFHARLKLKLPVLGRIAHMNAAAQFAGTLSTLLAAGLPVTRAAAVSASVLDNAWVSEVVQKQLAGLESGSTLAHCLNLSQTFPELLREMVHVGEETGALEDTLTVVSRYYENETQVAAQRALTLLEPIITLFLAVIVVFVLLAVYLPILSMYQGL